ncbi:hypothetical protein KAU39_02430, partial [bacterium]|nr:hypothetical protein [bacterium]
IEIRDLKDLTLLNKIVKELDLKLTDMELKDIRLEIIKIKFLEILKIEGKELKDIKIDDIKELVDRFGLEGVDISALNFKVFKAKILELAKVESVDLIKLKELALEFGIKDLTDVQLKELKLSICKLQIFEGLKLGDASLTLGDFILGKVEIRFRESGLSIEGLARKFDIDLNSLKFELFKEKILEQFSVKDIRNIELKDLQKALADNFGLELSPKQLSDIKTALLEMKLVELAKIKEITRAELNTLIKDWKLDKVEIKALETKALELTLLKMFEVEMFDMKKIEIKDLKDIEVLKAVVKKLDLKLTDMELKDIRLEIIKIKFLEILKIEGKELKDIKIDDIKEFVKDLGLESADLNALNFKVFKAKILELAKVESVDLIKLKELALEFGIKDLTDVQLKELKLSICKLQVLEGLKLNKLLFGKEIKGDIFSFINGEFEIKFGGKEMDLNMLAETMGLKLRDFKFELFKEELAIMLKNKEIKDIKDIQTLANKFDLKLNAKEMKLLSLDLLKLELKDWIKSDVGKIDVQAFADQFGIKLNPTELKTLKIEALKIKLLEICKIRDLRDVEIKEIAKDLLDLKLKPKEIDALKLEVLKVKLIELAKINDLKESDIMALAEKFGLDLKPEEIKMVKLEALKIKLIELAKIKDLKDIELEIKTLAEKFGLDLKPEEIKMVKLEALKTKLIELAKIKDLKESDIISLAKELGLKLDVKEINSLKLEVFKTRLLEGKLFEGLRDFKGDMLSFLKGEMKIDGLDIHMFAKKLDIKVKDFQVQLLLEILGKDKLSVLLKEGVIRLEGRDITLNGLAQELGLEVTSLKVELIKAYMLKMKLKEAGDLKMFLEFTKYLDEVEIKKIAKSKIREMLTTLEIEALINILTEKRLSELKAKDGLTRIETKELEAVPTSENLYKDVILEIAKKTGLKEEALINSIKNELSKRIEKGDVVAAKYILDSLFKNLEGEAKIEKIEKMFKEGALNENGFKIEMTTEFKKSLIKLFLEDSRISSLLKEKLIEAVFKGKEDVVLELSNGKQVKLKLEDIIDSKEIKEMIADKIINNEIKFENTKRAIEIREKAHRIKYEQEFIRMYDKMAEITLEIEIAKRNGDYKLADQKWGEYRKIEKQAATVDIVVEYGRKIEETRQEIRQEMIEGGLELKIKKLEAKLECLQLGWKIAQLQAKKAGLNIKISEPRSMRSLQKELNSATRKFEQLRDKLESEMVETTCNFEKLPGEQKNEIIDLINEKKIDPKNFPEFEIEGTAWKLTRENILIIKELYGIKGKYAELAGKMYRSKHMDIKSLKDQLYEKGMESKIERGESVIVKAGDIKFEITTIKDLKDARLLVDAVVLANKGLLYHIIVAKLQISDVKLEISKLKKETGIKDLKEVEIEIKKMEGIKKLESKLNDIKDLRSRFEEIKDIEIRIERLEKEAGDIYGVKWRNNYDAFKKDFKLSHELWANFMEGKNKSALEGTLFKDTTVGIEWARLCEEYGIKKRLNSKQIERLITEIDPVAMKTALVEQVARIFAKEGWDHKGLNPLKFNQQRAMIAEMLRDHTVALGTSAGKTLGFELEIALRHLLKGEEMKAMLVVEKTSAIAKMIEGTLDQGTLKHMELMKNFGLELVNGDILSLQGKLGETALALALKDSKTVVIFSKDTLGHLYNRIDSPILMKALKSQNVVRFDEIHMSLTERISYIVGGERTRALKPPDCREMIDVYREIDRMIDKGELKKGTLKQVEQNKADFYIDVSKESKEYALSDKAIKKLQDKGFESHQIDAAFRAKFLSEGEFSVVMPGNIEAKIAGREVGEIIPRTGGKAEYAQVISEPAYLISLACKHAKDTLQSAAKDAQKVDISVKYIMNKYKLKVSETKMQTSLAEVMHRNVGDSYAGATGTLRTAEDLYLAHIGRRTMDISGSYLDFRKVKEIKKLEVDQVAKDVFKSYLEGGKELVGIIDAVMYEQVKARLEFLFKDKYGEIEGKIKYEKVVREIGPNTPEAMINKYAKFEGDARIIISNERGLTGVDYKGNINLRLFGVERFTQDLLIQAMGRIRRNPKELGDIYFYINSDIALEVKAKYKYINNLDIGKKVENSIASAKKINEKLNPETMKLITEVVLLQQMIVRSEGLKFQIRETLWHKNGIMVLKDLIEHYNRKDLEGIDGMKDKADIVSKFLEERVLNVKRNDVDLSLKKMQKDFEFTRETVFKTGEKIEILLTELSKDKGLDAHARIKLDIKIKEIKDGIKNYDSLKFEGKETLSFAEARTFSDMIKVARSFEGTGPKDIKILESRAGKLQNQVESVRVEQVANKVKINVAENARIGKVTKEVEASFKNNKISKITIVMPEKIAIDNTIQLSEWANTAVEIKVPLTIVLNNVDGHQALWMSSGDTVNAQQLKDVYAEKLINPLLHSGGKVPLMTVKSNDIKEFTFKPEQLEDINQQFNLVTETDLLSVLTTSEKEKIVINVPSVNGKEIAAKIVDDLNVCLYSKAKEVEIRPFSIVDEKDNTFYSTAVVKVGKIKGIEVISVSSKQIDSPIGFAVLKYMLKKHAEIGDVERIVLNVPKAISNSKLTMLKNALESTEKSYTIIWGKTARTREIAVIKQGEIEMPCINDPKLRAWVEKSLVERALNLDQRREIKIKEINDQKQIPFMQELHQQMQQQPILNPYIIPGVNFGVPFTKLNGILEIRQGTLPISEKVYSVIRVNSLTSQNMEAVKIQIKEIAEQSDYVSIELRDVNKKVIDLATVRDWAMEEIGNNPAQRQVNIIAEGKVFDSNQHRVFVDDRINKLITGEVNMVFNLPNNVLASQTKIPGIEKVISINEQVKVRIIDQEAGIYAFDLGKIDNKAELAEIWTQIAELSIQKVVLNTIEISSNNRKFIMDKIAADISYSNKEVIVLAPRNKINIYNSQIEALSRADRRVFIEQIQKEFSSNKQVELVVRDEIIVNMLENEGIGRQINLAEIKQIEINSKGQIVGNIVSTPEGIKVVLSVKDASNFNAIKD